MSGDPLGLQFSEVMTGAFALGETDPQAGADRGKKENTTMSLQAKCSIDDLDAFIKDGNHAGQLDASVQFTPWGAAIPGDNSKLNLLSPGAARQERTMIYETRISQGGKSYYFAGKKFVHHEHGPEVLKETTTLYSVLHSGNDDSGPIVGAGILILGAAAIADLVKNMKVLNAKSPFDTARGIGKYLRFFMGSLWDSYIP
jgi:cholesterol oxidase